MHPKGCECGHCRLIRGQAVSGHCALCWKPGLFRAEDCFVNNDGFELWAHFECRQSWEGRRNARARAD